MSIPQTVGFNFLYAVINNQDRIALNRAKDSHFTAKVDPGSPVSERQLLGLIKNHVLTFRSMPDDSVLRSWGIPPQTTTQPVEYHAQAVKKRVVYSSYMQFQKQMEAVVINRDADALDTAYNYISDFKTSIAAIQVSDRYKDMHEVGAEIKQALLDRREGRPEVYVPFGWQTLDSLTGGAAAGDLVFFVGRPGMGKALPLESRILMESGRYKTMDDVQVGDRLASVDGKPNLVYGKYYQGERPCYRITFGDGRTCEADEDHLWTVNSKYYLEHRIVTTKNLFDIRNRATRYKNTIYVDTITGDFGGTDAFMSPYILGVLLGDGSIKRAIRFTSMDEEIVNRVKDNLPDNLCIHTYSENGKASEYAIVAKQGEKNTYIDLLKQYGIFGKGSLDKSIHSECFTWSRKDRLALLQGLMDTDGTVGLNKKGVNISYSSSSYHLITDVVRLIRSLGGKAKIQKTKKTKCADSYRITVILEDRSSAFSLPRKIKLINPYTTHDPRHLNIVNIEYIGTKATCCIAVTHDSKLFVIEEYIPTHNTNVLTQSALHANSQGKRVLFMSMEMTDLQISRRIFGSAGGYNWDKLRRGDVTDELITNIDDTIKRFEEGADFRIVSNQDKQTVDTVTALVDELSPDVVYIDAGYLMSVANSNAKAWEKLTVISEGLKRLATSRNIPVIISVQFNREASKGKRFELDTIAGSDAIGQLGSIIVAITEGDEPYKDTRRKLTIVKNREGGVDSFQIFNEFDPPNFSQVIDPIGTASEVFEFDEEI